MTSDSEILDAPDFSKRLKLFSAWQIVFVGCFSSGFFASLLLSYNVYRIGENKRKIVGILFFGLITSFRTLFFYGYHPIVVLIVSVLFQFVISYTLAFPIWNKVIPSELKFRKHKFFIVGIVTSLCLGYEYFSGRPHWRILMLFYNLLQIVFGEPT